MAEWDETVEVRLVLTKKLADQLRQPGGVTHDGPVTVELHDVDGQAMMTVKFPSPALRALDRKEGP